jgi:hypothetical protein
VEALPAGTSDGSGLQIQVGMHDLRQRYCPIIIRPKLESRLPRSATVRESSFATMSIGMKYHRKK